MAGEIESLATHEPLAQRIARHDYDRLIMLCDGVFAIAITLLALELPLPEHWDGRFGALIAGIGRPLIGYVFAFLMVGAFWVGHRRLMSRVDRVDVPMTLMTLLLLGLVGLAPLVARLFAEQGPSKAISVYLLLVGATLFVTSATGLYASLRKLTHHAVDSRSWRWRMGGGMVGAGLLVGMASFALAKGVPIDNVWLVGTMLLVAATVRFTKQRFAA